MTDSGMGSIGVFDSGVGGLSTLHAIRQAYPDEHLMYVADSGHAPYGDQAASAVIARAQAITHFLLDAPCKAIVVACNTASVVALPALRAMTSVPIIGMEPAIKPATLATRTGVVGVLATTRTVQSESVQRLIAQFGGSVRVMLQAAPGLVERVEQGYLADEHTRDLLTHYLTPLLAAGIDQLVLGCTHYYFLRPLITSIVGGGVTVVEPAEAIARQLGARSNLIAGGRVLEASAAAALQTPHAVTGGFAFYSSANDLPQAKRILSQLWGDGLTGRLQRLPV